ncbi:MAG: YbaB/EbfC family nucleoid-associated protein [Bradymonadales bacterium]|nr:YbaB/EbfC family nucleoid-associated protein [Bradymonadales bacterium]
MSNIKGGYNSIVRRAQKLQSQLSKLQDNLAERTVEVQVGGGLVKVTINGSRQVVDISIAPEVIDPSDPQGLQELLTAAFNEAIKNVQEMIDNETSRLTGGVNLPGML